MPSRRRRLLRCTKYALECYHTGSIGVVGGAKTISDITYRSGAMAISAATPGAEALFSVYEPTARIRFDLPTRGNGLPNMINGNEAKLRFEGTPNISRLDGFEIHLAGSRHESSPEAQPARRSDENFGQKLSAHWNRHFRPDPLSRIDPDNTLPLGFEEGLVTVGDLEDSSAPPRKLRDAKPCAPDDKSPECRKR